METLACIINLAVHPAVGVGGLALILGSVGTGLVFALVHVSAPKNEAFDAAVIEALEAYKARNGSPKSQSETQEIPSRAA